MNEDLTHFLDVDLIEPEDIDGLHPESVRINLSQGSFDVSCRRRGVELLPPRHAFCPLPLPPFLSLDPSVCPYQCVCCQWQWGAQRGRETSQYKVASAPLKAFPT